MLLPGIRQLCTLPTEAAEADPLAVGASSASFVPGVRGGAEAGAAEFQAPPELEALLGFIREARGGSLDVQRSLVVAWLVPPGRTRGCGASCRSLKAPLSPAGRCTEAGCGTCSCASGKSSLKRPSPGGLLCARPPAARQRQGQAATEASWKGR